MIPNKVFMIFAAGLAMLSACNQSTKNAPKGETYYETLEVAFNATEHFLQDILLQSAEYRP